MTSPDTQPRRAPAPKGRPKGSRPAPAAAPHEVRIIGGQWKRSKLPVADRPGLRPTPDRVRETLFNWLGQDLTGWRCIDAFAGSGALGFEAASRGAAEVLMLEQDAALVARLAAVKTRLGAAAVRIERGDGVAALGRAAPGSVDLVFLDPPFEAEALFAPALRAARTALRADGLVYLEAPRPWDADALAAHGLQPHRHLKAGAVHAHLLRHL
ncbi:16S rRNA (guanine(966)-N(2))-methyltransferase RsmD [Variovorax terrae]|uniref:16S rRNA (Guanine(966)-N(2))-methyltransferase RsmD n=1 Tax=Variovorax terrae TaxID=2923278 RepID=A0A9X1VSC0_9BURK|nr:16S rRNA (guanine(966)-N(2))-methyltransferase RsmD [Variovorax terrae]MCJ0762144.1 16S rRNA (guanine(966)-N(2))-methyltransferase RsmD [Variovorax terrae]